MAGKNRSKAIAGALRGGVTLRIITASDWPNIVRLFGPNGACGGCWCMWWRVPRGGKLWAKVKGSNNRAAFRRLVQQGLVHGVLAFSGEEPVGWCSFGPRSSFPRLERVRALKRDWSEGTWSINCFYVARDWRGCGIAKRLVEEATKRAFQSGASEVEGYPVGPATDGKALPAVFAWTGVPAMFQSNGYRECSPTAGRRRVFIAESNRPRVTTGRNIKESRNSHCGPAVK